MFLPQTEILLPQKVPAMLNANEAVAEVRMWQLRHTTCSKMENKQTNKLTVRAELAEMSEALRANTAPRAPTYRCSLSASSNMVL